jgi:hypothetical protein
MDDSWERQRLEALLPKAEQAQIAKLMEKRRIYWHVMPTLKQAKLVAWNMLKDFSRPIPGIKVNNSELEVTYPTGNIVRLMGADDPDSLRGPGLAGASLDEYSQIAPRARTSCIASTTLRRRIGNGMRSGRTSMSPW